MEKFEIKNRHGLKIVGEIHKPKNAVGVAFVLHGLGGFKEQVSIIATVDTLFKNGYIVISFDATNSIGESEGKYENATMQLHYEDLVDVTEWAKNQPWHKEPFVLAGSSLGGYAVINFAEEYPSKVKAVCAKAPVVSGKLSFKTYEKYHKKELKEWEETGWNERKSVSKPGIIKRLPWSHMKERLSHDLRVNISRLVMPVLLIVGENDTSCPPNQQKILFDLIPGPKELQIVKGAPHTFKEEKDLNELKNILDTWIKKI